MKSITISGRLGKTAELRRMQNGDAVLGFPVAVDDGFGDKKTTFWFDCSVWGKRAEKLAQYLTKGTIVSVSGDLGKREHEGKTYLTVRANELTMLGGGEKREDYDQSQGGARPANFSADLDDEVPF